jgi:hypothetical protein
VRRARGRRRVGRDSEALRGRPGLDDAARGLVRAALPLMKASTLAEIPAALMNVLLDIPDWTSIREALSHRNPRGLD